MQSGSITLEPDIDKIPRRPHTKTYTYGELRTATTGLDITHMFIVFDIPPSLENIAPRDGAINKKCTHLHFLCDLQFGNVYGVCENVPI